VSSGAIRRHRTRTVIGRHHFGESVVWFSGHVRPPSVLVLDVEDPGVMGVRWKILDDPEASRHLPATNMWLLFNQTSSRCDDEAGL